LFGPLPFLPTSKRAKRVVHKNVFCPIRIICAENNSNMCSWKFDQQRDCCLAGCTIDTKVFAKRRSCKFKNVQKATDIASKRALIFLWQGKLLLEMPGTTVKGVSYNNNE
jgi:hypothetical protein